MTERIMPDVPLLGNDVIDPLRVVEVCIYVRGQEDRKAEIYERAIGAVPLDHIVGGFFKIESSLAIAESPDLPLDDERLVLNEGLEFIGRADVPDWKIYDDI